MKDKNIIYYILGILSYMLLIPLIESLSEILCGWLERFKIENTKVVIKGNGEIATLQSQLEPHESTNIGFEIPNSTEYYDDEEDCNCKHKTGFNF